MSNSGLFAGKLTGHRGAASRLQHACRQSALVLCSVVILSNPLNASAQSTTLTAGALSQPQPLDLALEQPAADTVANQCQTRPHQGMVAHRGARAHWPDNTLASFQAAIEAGATALEVDVRMTADHHLVVMHDPLVDRTTTGHGMVHNLRFQHLRQLEIITAPDQRVPTVAEVLDLAAGRALVMLDLKSSGETYWQQLAQLVNDHPQRDQVILGVRSLEESHRLMTLMPGVSQLALTPKKRYVGDFIDAGVNIVRLWPKWLKKRPELGEYIRQNGVELYVPTTKNGPRRVRSLLCYQPNFIQTDDPVKLSATLEILSQQEAALLLPH